ncbi:hypothetical protein Tco_0873069 [Tanacetum coccineum]
MSLSLAKNVIVVGADNHPPMLDKTNYSSWESRMLLYIKGKEHGKLHVDSVLNEPFQYRTIIEPVNETTPATLINDMHTIIMTMKPLQVNTKFANHLQPEWSKFVTDAKLAKDIHTTKFDHLYAYLRQHEAHANEVRLQKQSYPDQIALVANSPSCLNPTQYYPQLSSATQQYYSPPASQHSYDAPILHQSQYQPQVVTHSSMVQQQPYHAPALQQSYQAHDIYQPLQPSFLELDS